MHSVCNRRTHQLHILTSIFNYTLTFCIILHACYGSGCVNLYRHFSDSFAFFAFASTSVLAFLSRFFRLDVCNQCTQIIAFDSTLYCIYHTVLCAMSGERIFSHKLNHLRIINKLEYLPFCHFSFNCVLNSLILPLSLSPVLLDSHFSLLLLIVLVSLRTCQIAGCSSAFKSAAAVPSYILYFACTE